MWRDIFRMDYFLLALVGGLCAHISVNAINEYDDFTTGLDHTTTRTPFSGGSGTLPRHPEKAWYAAAVGVISLAVTVLIGILFFPGVGVMLLPIGILGIFADRPLHPLADARPAFMPACPGIGFGPVHGHGHGLRHDRQLQLWAFAASLVPFFLVSGLLLVNQFPDILPDAGVGRRHLMIAYGKKAGVTVYGLFLAGTYLSIVFAWLAGWFPSMALLSLFTAPLAVYTAFGCRRHTAMRRWNTSFRTWVKMLLLPF
jgi:1,4-dihydroxy-2-naphthoate polyprenyltransferase